MSLDREIEDLLAVDPSPDFVARVRQRVADAPVPGRSWFSWKLVPVGAMGAAAAMAVLMWPSSQPVQPVPSAPAAELTAPVAGIGIASVPAPVAASSATRVRVPRSANRPVAELVLSVEEQRAFALLIMTVDDDVLPEVPPQEAAVGPAWIQIDPVAITPIGDSGAE